MDILNDTNVLLRVLDKQHPSNRVIVEATDRLVDAGYRLVVTTQNLVELWAVVTRPVSSNGLGLTVRQAEETLGLIETAYFRLPDHHDHLFAEWKTLVLRHKVSGKQVHDARLVAAMRVHGVRRILTFNVGDFARYSELITAVHPAEAAA